MKIFSVLASVTLAAILLAPAPLDAAARNRSKTVRVSPPLQSAVMPGVVIVKVRHGYTVPEGALLKGSDTSLSALRSQGVSSLARTFKPSPVLSDAEVLAGKIDLSAFFYALIDRSQDPRAVAARISSLPQVEYAEPKYIGTVCDVPNDSGYTAHQQAYMTRMNAPAGWSIAKGSASVVIATVDGGTNWAHPDLQPNLWINGPEDINHDGIFEPVPPPAGDLNGIDEDHNGFVDDVVGWNFGNNSPNPRGFQTSLADHGTGTASSFGAVTNNSMGMAGTSWNCRVMPICASLPASTNSIDFGFEGIVYAFMNGAKVINCSWGREGNYSQFEQDIVTAASQAGALIVAAAGNNSLNTDLSPFYPADYTGVLSVGATLDVSDEVASFSNIGANVTVFAPGVNIWIALDNGGYGFGAGTSFSSPLVAGLAGILRAVHPAWSTSQIVEQIRVTADSIDGNNPGIVGLIGRGRVNFGRALSESHAGIAIVSSSIHTPSGGTILLPGDTLVLSVTVRNVLGTTANNLSFTASATDPVLHALQAGANVATLDSGQQSVLTDFTFQVGSLTSTKNVSVRLDWVSNVNDRDVRSFRAYLFPSKPLWLTQSSPTSNPLNSVKAVNTSSAWAAGSASSTDGPAVIKTTNGGTTWTDVTANLTGIGIYCVDAVDESRAWVGTASGLIYATTNGGASWFQQSYPGTQSPFIDGIWFFDANNGFALGDPLSGGRFVVLQTTNGGSSWSHLANEPVGISTEAGWNNSFWWSDPSHGWFGTNNSKTWRTTDGGATWSSATTGSTNSIAIAFGDPLNGIVGFDAGQLYRTTSGGASWVGITSPTAAGVFGLSFVSGTASACLVDPSSPFRTDNNGTSWVQQLAYPASGSITHVSLADTGNGWMVTSAGEVLRYGSSGVTSVPRPPVVIPGTFVLEQNYPNPFNPSTAIRYQLSAASFVTLKVYNVLGEEIVTLVDEAKQPGTYSVRFDGSRLASGVYFYRLVARPYAADGRGGFTAVRRMVLLK